MGGLAAAAAVAGAAMAVAASRRKVCVELVQFWTLLTHDYIYFCIALQTKVVERDHGLKGILNKRISLFSNITQHTKAERPPRRGEIEATSYRLHNDATIVAPV